MSTTIRDLDDNEIPVQDVQILADKVRCCNCGQEAGADRVSTTPPGSFWRCACKNVTVIFYGDFAECWVLDGIYFDYFQTEEAPQNWLIRLPQEEADILEAFGIDDDTKDTDSTDESNAQ